MPCEHELQILHMFCSSVHSKIMFDQANDKFQVIGSAPKKKIQCHFNFKINIHVQCSINNNMRAVASIRQT